MSQTTVKKPRFIKPPNTLKMKVGSGGINEKLLNQAQHLIETNTLEFTPYAQGFLQNFSNAVRAAQAHSADFKTSTDPMIIAMMKLKSSGGMFQYPLLSDVAAVALDFLEDISELNTDVFEVLLAHEKTIKIIIDGQIKGSGGPEGKALAKELKQACKRYFGKHGKVK
jgi:hypothetical protein